LRVLKPATARRSRSTASRMLQGLRPV